MNEKILCRPIDDISIGQLADFISSFMCLPWKKEILFFSFNQAIFTTNQALVQGFILRDRISYFVGLIHPYWFEIIFHMDIIL